MVWRAQARTVSKCAKLTTTTTTTATTTTTTAAAAGATAATTAATTATVYDGKVSHPSDAGVVVGVVLADGCCCCCCGCCRCFRWNTVEKLHNHYKSII